MEENFENKNKVNVQNPEASQNKASQILGKDNLKEYLGIQEKAKSSNFKDRLDFLFGEAWDKISQNNLLQEFKYFWTPKRLGILGGFLLVCFLFFYFFAAIDVKNNNPVSQYRLVPEKISKSAAIKISLPPEFNLEDAKSKIKFEPSISGNWVDEKGVSFIDSLFAVAANSTSKSVVFKPNNPLAINRYYNISLSVGDKKNIKADFLAVDDPKIEAVFPNEEEETPEDSKITIVFSRPIVALTTLDNLDKKDIPVEISPETEGSFRWISTNTLQFQPTKNLITSANYTIKIKDTFTSLDGVNISGGEYKFKTRNLRYLSSYEYDQKTAIYNEPIRIYFNQPVDIKKTASEIKLNDGSQDVPFYISYSKKKQESVASEEKKDDFGLRALGEFATSTLESINPMTIELPQVSLGGFIIDDSIGGDYDKSIIEIYNKVDRFGREKFWNLESTYNLSLKKVYPLDGDISLDKERSISINTTGIIKSLDVESKKTNYSSQKLFDPEGSIIFNFYEDIDISKSSIGASVPVDKISYGEECSDSNLSLDDSSCQKVSNKKQVVVLLNSKLIQKGSTIEVKLKKIINTLDQKINNQEISEFFEVYNPLEVSIGKSPYENNTSQLILCSNNPLIIPDKKDFKNKIKANLDYEVFYWNGSWQDSSWERSSGKFQYCPNNLFATSIDVGLIPEQEYTLDLEIEDVFGQKVFNKESFVTEKIKEQNISIFSMQQLYSVTSPNKTVLSFGVKNLDYVNLEICKKFDAYGFYTAYKKSDYSFLNCESVKEAEIQLSKKYWVNNYFEIDIKKYFDSPIGNYIIKISNPKYAPKYGEPNIYSFLSVTNLAVAEKKIELGGENVGENDNLFGELKNIYWITDVNTQAAIEGAKVKLYSSGKIVEGVSDNQGLAFVTPVSGLEAVVVEYGKDSTTIVNWQDSLNYASDAYSVKKSYIYTDRPIYRPGDNVNIKGIIRIGYDGNYQINQTKVKVFIENPRGEKISEEEIDLSEFGTFITSFSIGTESALGSYSICTSDYNCGYFNVLEYVPAAFEVKATTDKDEYVSKDNIKISLDAGYYFGVPVDNAEVEYTVSSQNYYFDKFKDGYYDFDYSEDDYYYSNDYYYGDKFLFRGKTTLDANGKGLIDEKIDLDKMFKNSKSSKIIVFDINVKNSFGQSVSYQKSVILHAGEFYIGASIEPYFIKKNEKFALGIKTVDIYGKSAPVNDVNIRFYKIDWEYSKRQESEGGYNYIWEKKLTLVKSSKTSITMGGNYHSNLEQLESEGAYELQISATDSKGNNVYTNGFLYVYGDGQVSIRSQEDTELSLKAVKTNLKEGDNGEVIIESPFPKAKALITIERGRVFEYQVVDIVGGLYSFKFNAKKNYAPNVYVSVLLHSSDPQVKFGSKEFFVDSAANKLTIDLSSDKEYYAPGDEVKLRIVTRDSGLTSAEVSLAVVDASVLALEGNPKKDPFSFFYSGFPLTVSTSSNIKSIIMKEDVKQTKGGSGGGSSESGKSVPRGEFKDTAFWKGDIITNGGYGELSFRLPDNLTRWQVEALGVTTDTKIGSAYLEFVSRKELMIVPLKPRFILPGDSFYIGAKVFNQSDEKKSVNVSFDSDTLVYLGGKKETLLNIEKGGSQSVYFSVKAPLNISSGFHSFAINADIQDDSKSLVPCSAEKDSSPVRGKCGASSGKKTVAAPEIDLCDSGIATEVSGPGPWSWSCDGANGGKSVSCSAGKEESLVEGKCGDSDNKSFSSLPDSAFCSSGTPSAITNSWTWICYGGNGGKDANCRAQKSNNIIQNQCGGSNGKKLFSIPKKDLCLKGNSSVVTGSGPWNWTCGNNNDSVQQKIIIKPNTTYETVATSSYTTENLATEVVYVPENVSKDMGGLSIRASATLAVFLSDSLNYLIQYPYGCSEQLSSKLKGLAIVKQSLNIPNIADKFKLEKVDYEGNKYDFEQLMDIGLQKLYKNQNYDGGFSLWGGSESSYFVSLKVLDALVELNKAGKIKDDDVKLKKTVDYVYNNFTKNEDIAKNPDNAINAAFNIISIGKYKDDKNIKTVLENIIKDDGVLKDKISNQSLAKLSIVANRGGFSWGTDSKLNKLLENRLNIDSRGAFIEPKNENIYWSNYETSIGDTSLYLRSLVAGKRETSSNDKIIRWILNSRSKDGSWGSTQNTVAVIEAFVEFLGWKKETESNYELVIKVNGEKAESFSFNSGNIFDQINKKIDVNNLKSDNYNTVEFDKSKHRALFKDSLYYDMSFKYYLSGNVDSRDEGFTITRGFYSLDDKENKNNITSIVAGNIIKAHLEVVVPKERRFVLIEDFIPAGMEIVDMDLATEQKSLRFVEKEVKNNYLYPDFKELRDDRAVIYKEYLYPGIYEFDYYVRPLVKGSYFHLPAVVSEIYSPENFGRTKSSYFEIK